MATEIQLHACCEKIAAKSVYDSIQFKKLMAEADELAFDAAMLRQQAWKLYAHHVPRKPSKAKPADNSDLI
jgi:hypothetical protein